MEYKFTPDDASSLSFCIHRAIFLLYYLFNIVYRIVLASKCYKCFIFVAVFLKKSESYEYCIMKVNIGISKLMGRVGISQLESLNLMLV